MEIPFSLFLIHTYVFAYTLQNTLFLPSTTVLSFSINVVLILSLRNYAAILTRDEVQCNLY